MSEASGEPKENHVLESGMHSPEVWSAKLREINIPSSQAFILTKESTEDAAKKC